MHNKHVVQNGLNRSMKFTLILKTICYHSAIKVCMYYNFYNLLDRYLLFFKLIALKYSSVNPE